MQLKFSKRNISKIVAIFCTYCLCVMPVNASSYYSISFTKYPQQDPSWCWVATAECSGKHLRYTDRTQLGAATEIKTKKGKDIYEGGTIFETAEAAEYFTHGLYDYEGFDRKYSFAVLKAQLMKNYLPIIACGDYMSYIRLRGHAVVVHLTAQSNDGVQTVGYYDPLDNKSYYMTYTELCDGSRNDLKYDNTCIIMD